VSGALTDIILGYDKTSCLGYRSVFMLGWDSGDV
jgi:hypothetical protein